MRALTSKQVTAAVAKAKSKLADFEAVTFTTEVAASFVLLAASVVRKHPKPLTGDQANAAYNSCAHLIGTKPTKEMLIANFYRLVANWYIIDEGAAIPQWGGEPITSDVAFLAVKKGRIPVVNGKRQYKVRIRLKTGLCAGIISWVVLNERLILRFLDRLAGTKMYRCSAEEIAGMEARVVVDSNNGAIHLSEFNCTQAQKEANKKLAEARADVRKCRAAKPCNICAATVAECPLAVWAAQEG